MMTPDPLLNRNLKVISPCRVLLLIPIWLHLKRGICKNIMVHYINNEISITKGTITHMEGWQHNCATLFRALRTAAGRWVAEEGHGDPSQACIILMPADSAV
jgi:hypothetical protein